MVLITPCDCISVKVTPNSSAGQLEVRIQVDRSVGGGTVDFPAVATGTIRLFRHALDLEIRDGVTENWGFSTRDLEFNVDVEVAGADAGTASTTLVLPGPFQLRFPIPTTLPLGLNVAVTFNLVADVELPALASASTQLSATFRYEGSAGFHRTGTAGFTTEGSNGSTTVEVSGLCIESGAQHTLRGTVTAGFFGIDLAELGHDFFQDDLFKDTSDCPP